MEVKVQNVARRQGTTDHEYMYRIGNEKTRCKTCNRYWQAVLRRTTTLFREGHREVYLKYRRQAELDVYREILTEYSERGLR